MFPNPDFAAAAMEDVVAAPAPQAAKVDSAHDLVGRLKLLTGYVT